MGYEVYITRARHSWDTAKRPISKARWDAVVAADPSLEVSSEDWVEWRTKRGGTERSYAVIWTGHPEQRDIAFWFTDGAISTKGPDDSTIEKMVELAERLGARVLGEENEAYRRGGRVVREGD
jgi:hypothetical protein